MTWILLARAKEVEDRKPVSLLHLWYVLMAAIASDELGPPYGLFSPAVAPSAPLVALPAQQLPLLQDCALLLRPPSMGRPVKNEQLVELLNPTQRGVKGYITWWISVERKFK